MNLIRSVIGECAIVIIAACVAIGGFIEVRNLPFHEHNYIQVAYHQYAISLGLGLLLGGAVVSSLAERAASRILLGVMLLLLANSSLLWAMYAWTVKYWQLYIPLCIICAFAGVALARAVRLSLVLRSLDRRVIVLLAWICTLGIVGLFVNNAFRQDIRKLRVTTVLSALIPICLGILGFWGAMNAGRLLLHLGENSPMGLSSLSGAIVYLVSVLIIRQNKLTDSAE